MQNRVSKLVLKRMIALLLSIVLGFSVCVGSLVYIQIINGEEYQKKALAQQMSDTTVEAKRGTIYDSNMNILVQSADVWIVYLDPRKITDKNRQQIADGLSELLDVEKEDILEKSEQNVSYVKVKSNVEYDDKQKVDEFRSQNDLMDAVGISPSTKRYYSNRSFAATVLGFVGTDNQGLEGLEAYYNNTLTGTAGRIISAKNALSYNMPNNYESIIDAQEGNSLVLTIDDVIQYSLDKNLEQALNDAEAKYAYGIVMDVKTGAILGMSNKEDYYSDDPWAIKDEAVQKEIDEIENDEERSTAVGEARQAQWRNRTISDTYEPGSVFKVVVAAAALEEGVVGDTETLTCIGYIKIADRTYNCHVRAPGHGTETFAEGIQNSCNPWFITVGQRMGIDTFYKYMEAFGITEKTGIDLPGEAEPVKGVTYHNKDDMGVVELASVSFGQSFQVSPIQMITAVAAVANGGKLMTPYVVKEVLDADGNVVSTTEPEVKRQVVSEETAKKLCLMLEDVVTEGTGKNAYVAGYRVAGKTGTSEKLYTVDSEGGKKYVTSFVAFAPADDPQVAVLIAVDEPSKGVIGGSTNAAPAVAAVIEDTLKYLNVQPQYTAEELAEIDKTTPNLSGATVTEAKYKLSAEGLTYRIVGDGDKVVGQSPAADRSIPSGGQVIIYTEADYSPETVEVPNFTGMTVAQVNAAAAGLNIKFAGNSLSNSTVTAYRQTVDAGKNVDVGTVVTVYFIAGSASDPDTG